MRETGIAFSRALQFQVIIDLENQNINYAEVSILINWNFLLKIYYLKHFSDLADINPDNRFMLSKKVGRVLVFLKNKYGKTCLTNIYD